MASPRFLAACAAALLLGLGPVAASAQTTLTMSSWVGPNHLLTKDVLQAWATSVENAPDAGMTGFLSVTRPIFTDMSTIRAPPGDRTPALRCRPAAVPSCR